MFGLFKRKRTRTQPETNSTPPPMTHWGLSEEEQLLDQISEYTYGQLERQKVSLNSRQFIWQGGKRLSVSQVAQRLHKGNVHMPVEYIEDAILSWLEEAYEPEGITDGDMEEAAQMAVEEWIQAHYEQRD